MTKAARSNAGTKMQSSIGDLVELIPNGSSIALGGSFLHRSPNGVTRELVRQQKQGIELIKQSPGYDVDLLCRAGVVDRVKAGIVALEGNYGLARYYRKGVEDGSVQLEEHACATLTAGLRASAFGIPFQLCAGIDGSQLAALNGWEMVEDPYGSGRHGWAIPPIEPDIAILHVNDVSPNGDGRVVGTSHWDRIMSRSAKKVYLVAERMASMESFEEQPNLTLVPDFLVDAFVIAPMSAWPGSCWPEYEVDYAAIDDYLVDGKEALDLHLDRGPEGEASHVTAN